MKISVMNSFSSNTLENNSNITIRGNSLYTFVFEGDGYNTWTEARNLAAAQGWDLATINSFDENEFVMQFLGGTFPDLPKDIFGHSQVHIGLTRDIDPSIATLNQGGYLDGWISGEFSEWRPFYWGEGGAGGEPNAPYTHIMLGWTEENLKRNQEVGFWNDAPDDQPYAKGYGLVEIPLTLTSDLPESVEEGTEFTVDIILTAGTTGSELTEGNTIWYTYEITGVDGNGDPDVYSVTGSGLIDANGQFDDEDGETGLQVTIEKDWLINDDQFLLTFYSDDPRESGSELGFTDPGAYRDAIQIDVDQTAGAGIVEGVAVADILSNPDPITGELGLRKKVKLKNRGIVSFRLYGSEDIDVNAIDFDSILFGGDPDVLIADDPGADGYFQGAQRKKGKKAGSYRDKVIDIDDDGFDDIKIKALRRDIVGVMEKGDKEIYAYAETGEESVLWSNTDTVFF